MSIWDVGKGIQVGTIRGLRFALIDIAFDEKGGLLHTVDESREVKTWRYEHEQLARVFPITPAWGGALSPDGTCCAVSVFDLSVRVIDAETGRLKSSDVFESDTPWAVAFSPDGKSLATGSTNGTIYLLDLIARKRRGTLPPIGRDWPSTTVAWSPDGKRIAAGGQGRRLCVWDVVSCPHFLYQGL